MDPAMPQAGGYGTTVTVVPRAGSSMSGSVNTIESGDERAPLLGRSISSNANALLGPVVYSRRWYILIVFSILAFIQGCVWNTWGAIAVSTKIAFNWDDADIALQANWGTITYILSAVFFGWLLDNKGIRWSCVIVAILLTTATGIRCIPADLDTKKWILNIASILNGFGGPVAMATAPLLSATWFPVHQRNTATAVGCTLNGIGVGMSFIIGPAFVHVPGNHTGKDDLIAVDELYLSKLSDSSNYSKKEVEDLQHSIMNLMYAEFIVTFLTSAAILIYFPGRPPSPPSHSAAQERVQFVSGIKEIASHKEFWLLGGTYAISTGVYNVWTAIIVVNLQPIGISEYTAGYIGFVGVLAGNLVAVIISIFADMFARNIKWFLVVMYSVGSVAFLIFALGCASYIPPNLALFYVCMVVGSICISGAVPLLFELICETTYPIAEGLTNMCVTLLNNVAGLLFLLVMMAPMTDKIWMNWTVFACTFVCLPVFCVYRPRYTRLELDMGASKQL